MHIGRRLHDKTRVRVDPFRYGNQPRKAVHLEKMLNALGVALIIGNHPITQKIKRAHSPIPFPVPFLANAFIDKPQD